jgi:L-threonylcarbamoyladenylate synthase
MKIINLKGNNSRKVLDQCAQVLKNGGICVCPTDTVYGLLANASDESAVKRIYRLKNRGAAKPLPIFVKNIEATKKIAVVDSKIEKKLRNAWPGKTTFVLKLIRGTTIPAAGENTIALRIPDHPFLSILLNDLDFPVVGTSANLAGLGPFTKIAEVLEQFKSTADQPDLVVDAGNLPESKPSTIIDLTRPEEKILRK